MKYLIFILLSICMGRQVYAANYSNPQITYFTGTQLISYQIKSTDSSTITSTKAPLAASFTQLPMGLDIEFARSHSDAIFIRGSTNFASSSTASATFITVGSNFYTNTISSKAAYKNELYTLSIIPKWRFYWGIQLGMAFFNYPSLEDLVIKQSSDLLFIPGAQAGGYWHFSESFSLRAELGAGMAFGSKSSGTVFNVLLGLTHLFGDVL